MKTIEIVGTAGFATGTKRHFIRKAEFGVGFTPICTSGSKARSGDRSRRSVWNLEAGDDNVTCERCRAIRDANPAAYTAK
jgi:hypothetical protein